MDESILFERITCDDLRNAGVWTGECCTECHHIMDFNVLAGVLLPNRTGDFCYSSQHGLFSIACCHSAIESLVKMKLDIQDLRKGFLAFKVAKKLVFNLFKDVIDSETNRKPDNSPDVPNTGGLS